MNTAKKIETNLKRWVYPSNYCGTDWSDYYVGLVRSCDSDCLERSNFDSLLELLGGETPERDDCEEYDVIVAHDSHWAVGWIETILVYKDNLKGIEILSKA